METTALRAMIAAGAETIDGARIWPNGLGFTARGWEFMYNERERVWTAVYKPLDRSLHDTVRVGRSPDGPSSAREAARVRRS